MLKKAVCAIISVICLACISGCATANVNKQKDLEVQGLKNRMSLLQTQLQEKDRQIYALKEALQMAVERKAGPAKAAEAKSQPSIKDIQAALKNAGYNLGSIDGKMGKQTRDAVKAFQKANNLTADGRVGEKTWALLKQYLYKD